MAESMNVEQTRSRRWLARLSLLFALLAVVIVVVFADLHSIAMLAVGAVVSLGAVFVFLSRRGVVRWLAAAAFVLAPVAVLVVFAFAGLAWAAVAAAASWALAVVTGRQALAPDRADWQMPEHPAAPPPARPFLIMNPRSGGGKVGKFDLKRK